MLRRWTASFLFLLLITFCTQTQAQLARLPEFPEGYINDYARLLGAADKKRIEEWAKSLDDRTSAQLAVVTLDSTKPEGIAQYSVRLFDKWKIGKKGKDNGVLLLVAVKDREAWIATGYGLEGALPDVICSQIVRNIMIPYFKRGDYSSGIREGSKSIVSLVAKEYGVQITGDEQNVSDSLKNSSDMYSPLTSLLVWICIVIILIWLSKKSGGYRYGGGGGYSGYGGSGGGFSGGFGGFGGGSTGGGGGGGRW